MRIEKFYRDSFLLTISNLVTGIMGFIFSIFLSRELGAEGLGLFSVIMPVYILLLCLTSDGLITAISKISALYWNKKDYTNLYRTMSTIFVFIFIWSLSVAIISYICSSGICYFFIKDPRSSYALKIISPALVFVPMSSILKGYFYGMGKFKITASVDIIEKTFRVIALLGSIAFLALHDVESTVTAAYFALAAGELLSLSFLYIIYKIKKKKHIINSCRIKRRPQLLFDVLVISFPICLNGFLTSILSTITTLILPRRLMSAGFEYNFSLSLIGKFLGMALTITSLPFIVINSMQTVLIPDLSLSMSNKDFWAMEKRISQVLKISCLVGISSLIISLSISDILGILFYNRKDLSGMISFAAISSFFNYVASPTYGIMNALGKQTVNLRNSIIVTAESLILIYILVGIPAINIYGYGIALIVNSITYFFLNIYELKKVCDLKLEISELITYLFVGILAFYILTKLNVIIPSSLILMKTGITTILGFALVFIPYRFLQRVFSNTL